MEHTLTRWADELLQWLGVGSSHADSWDRWMAFALVVVAVMVVDYMLRLVVVRGVRHLVERTKTTWDDEILTPTLLARGCHILSAIVLMVVTPVVFGVGISSTRFIVRMVDCYFTVTILRFIMTLLAVAFHAISLRPAWHNKPIKGLRQTAQGVVLIIGTILIISMLVDKSPAILLTGLGASAAVMMLIFKDSILGFVSGIQLSANDMLQVGDWISMPKYGADGTVEEVNLTTVKIRNFDKTIVTLPPYLLVSESFQNWRGMQLSGGRRVMRSISIDMSSIRFCSQEMLDHYRSFDLLKEYIDQTEQRIEEYNSKNGIDTSERRINGLHQTNLGVFRAYLERYLRHEVPINPDMMLMVRQLQPTETGLPLQLYFFTDTVVWAEYEKIQADVFDHVLAIVPEFGLRVFQNPAGSDISQLTDK